MTKDFERIKVEWIKNWGWKQKYTEMSLRVSYCFQYFKMQTTYIKSKANSETQNWNSSRKFDVFTMDIPWVRLLNLWRSLFISSAILKLSSYSYSWATNEFCSLCLRQTSGLASRMKLLETKKLFMGEDCSFSRLLIDFMIMEQ